MSITHCQFERKRVCVCVRECSSALWRVKERRIFPRRLLHPWTLLSWALLPRLEIEMVGWGNRLDWCTINTDSLWRDPRTQTPPPCSYGQHPNGPLPPFPCRSHVRQRDNAEKAGWQDVEKKGDVPLPFLTQVAGWRKQTYGGTRGELLNNIRRMNVKMESCVLFPSRREGGYEKESNFIKSDYMNEPGDFYYFDKSDSRRSFWNLDSCFFLKDVFLFVEVVCLFCMYFGLIE